MTQLIHTWSQVVNDLQGLRHVATNGGVLHAWKWPRGFDTTLELAQEKAFENVVTDPFFFNDALKDSYRDHKMQEVVIQLLHGPKILWTCTILPSFNAHGIRLMKDDIINFFYCSKRKYFYYLSFAFFPFS